MPASTSDGIARLSIATGAPVMPVFMVRQGDTIHHHIKIMPAFYPEKRRDREAAALEYTQLYSDVLETAIREHPDHWNWIHRRWKTRPPGEPRFTNTPQAHSYKEIPMADRVQIIGSYLSPYVRKVLVVLDLKGIPYESDPIVPFYGDERFSQISPVRRIPVLIDSQATLTDSSVICQYLEDLCPEPALYPANIVDRARARWLEEYADSRMGEVFIWRLFNQVAIKPNVWGEQTDNAIVAKTLSEEIPQILDYLETQLPAEGFIFGKVSIADISIACFFRNAAFARFKPDASRWPRTAALVERTLNLPSFQKLKPIEERMLRTPIAQHRAALTELGIPITQSTYGTAEPRRGLMRID